MSLLVLNCAFARLITRWSLTRLSLSLSSDRLNAQVSGAICDLLMDPSSQI